MSCIKFYGRFGTLLSTPTLRTFGVQGGANGSDSSGISSSRSGGTPGSTTLSRRNRNLEQMVHSLLKAAQEQKEETLVLRSQLKALEEKIENNGQN